jgi:STAM-binding protein
MRFEFAEARREVNRNLERLDILRPTINRRYEQYQQARKDIETRRAATKEERDATPYSRSFSQQGLLEPSPTQTIEAGENEDFAVRLAQKEMSRRAAERAAKSNEGHDLSGVEVLPPRVTPSGRSEHQQDGEELNEQLQMVAAKWQSLHPTSGEQASVPGRRSSDKGQTSSLKYPLVPSNHGSAEQNSNSRLSANDIGLLRDSYDAILPPHPPPRPPRPLEIEPPPQPRKVNHSMTPSSANVYTFAPAACLENGTLLRTLFLPPTIRTTFLRVAHKNTLANLETCAFLAGTLISNALFVSKVIVPAQTATTDTCEMTNESQLFDYVDSEADLMILGWIHTHPTQTCFMSSRDLHTHAGYQMMLAESVAIVCAPSKGDTSHGGDWGVYRLTDPPGKKTILECEQPGIFHPHDVDNIYTDALRPGHVVEAKGLEFELVDLRDGGK